MPQGQIQSLQGVLNTVCIVFSWLFYFLIALAVIFIIVRVWKSLKEINDIVPWIALFTVGGAVVLYWTYERTEPKVLSPSFDQLSKILPSKIEYKDAKTP